METLKCMVCGMDINDKNYSLNKFAFIGNNSLNNIIYCPFCGAEKKYLKEDGKVYKVEENLDLKTKKILDNAMKLEVFNGDFYMEASKLVQDTFLKNRFRDLSKIEYVHARIHKNMGMVEKLPILNKLDYKRYDSDEKLLALAKLREEHAVGFYKKYINNVSSHVIKKVFTALIQVEEDHIILTTKK